MISTCESPNSIPLGSLAARPCRAFLRGTFAGRAERFLQPANMKSSYILTLSLGRNGREDLTGKQFGRLTVRNLAGIHKGRCHWQCVCICGVQVIVCASTLKRGQVKSCGCLSVQVNRSKGKKYFRVFPSEYLSWSAMRQRCSNPQHDAWKDYGGRGIKVCKRWNSFANFLLDMGTRPPGRSIHRIDNNRGYKPSNCCWGTRKQQAQNRRLPNQEWRKKSTALIKVKGV